MWSKRDWKLFYQVARNRRAHLRPPRPVLLSDRQRLEPAEGFSLDELDAAGISLERAERLGLPVDMGRNFSFGPNIEALRGFVFSSRG
jgi:ribosomal protein L13E